MHRRPSSLLAVATAALFVALTACGDPATGENLRDTGGSNQDSGRTDVPLDDVDTPDTPGADTEPDAGDDGGTPDVDTPDSGTPDGPCVHGAIRTCFDGDEALIGVGHCRAGTQVCDEGVWGDCDGDAAPRDEICDGVDDDCDGLTDEGVANACGACGPEQLEVCEDGLDNDCNGTIDDVSAGCACGGRLDQPCYSGPPQTLGVGLCVGGTMDCVEGAWGTCEGAVTPVAEICDDLDNDCDGATDEGTRNACGECGSETPAEVCDGSDNDCDGLVDEGVRGVCGACLDEVGEETCGDGFDNDCDGLVDEGCGCGQGTEVCYPGDPEQVGVGACAAGTRTCGATGETWGLCSGFTLPGVEVCDGEDNDCDGTTDIGADGCSICGTDMEICDGEDNDCDGSVDEGLRNPCGDCIADVTPEEDLGPEACDGLDDDCDGFIDEGLVNECGTCDDESCTDCDFFVEGWSAEERCGDGQDNNNNGLADEGCPCEFGTSQSCFLGAPNSRRIGACLDGTQTCVNRDDPQWGPCEGGIAPSEEVCDDKDNDCNGCVDEGLTCDVTITCPVEDTITPLQTYNLVGDTVFAGEADSWRWSVEAPIGSTTTGPADPNAENTSFYVDLSGDYRVTVEVTIGGVVQTCTWIVHARGSGVRVELVWDTWGRTDIDLHLHRPGSTADWCHPVDDCYYANCDDGSSPAWGYPDSTEGCPDGAPRCPNPRLDIDNIDLVGVPENINLDNPNDGDTFRVMVHFFSSELEGGGFFDPGNPIPTQPEVRIYCGGYLSASLGVAPDTVTITEAARSCQGDSWRVADITVNLDEDGIATCDIDVLGSGGGWDVRNDDDSY